MKIAVYAICKNEAKFVSRFAESAKDADGVFVLDTGSTDETIAELAKTGITHRQEVFTPWRFDVARNAALEMVPSDYDACVILDMDEVLMPGWRTALESHFKAGATLVQADYVWAFAEDGKPLLNFYMDRAHLRHGYRWKGACHENIRATVPSNERIVQSDTFKIHHHADPKKSRGQYLALLITAREEEPYNDRNCYYLAREFFNYGRLNEAVGEFKRHIAMPHGWYAERASSMMHLGICFQKQGDTREAERWFMRACTEDPDTRKNWLSLAQFYNDLRMWPECYAAAQRALRVTSRAKVYLDQANCWGALPYDLAGTAAWYIGLHAESVTLLSTALQHEPQNERLRGNLALCQGLMHDHASLPST